MQQRLPSQVVHSSVLLTARCMLQCRTTGNPEILLANETLLLEAIKKAPSKWPWLKDYNMVVYNNPGGPRHVPRAGLV